MVLLQRLPPLLANRWVVEIITLSHYAEQSSANQSYLVPRTVISHKNIRNISVIALRTNIAVILIALEVR